MKKIASYQDDSSKSAKVAQGLHRKKLFAVALFTSLMLIVVSEGLRLAFMNW